MNQETIYIILKAKSINEGKKKDSNFQHNFKFYGGGSVV